MYSQRTYTNFQIRMELSFRIPNYDSNIWWSSLGNGNHLEKSSISVCHMWMQEGIRRLEKPKEAAKVHRRHQDLHAGLHGRVAKLRGRVSW
jgi:hypothetical protein